MAKISKNENYGKVSSFVDPTEAVSKYKQVTTALKPMLLLRDEELRWRI